MAKDFIAHSMILCGVVPVTTGNASALMPLGINTSGTDFSTCSAKLPFFAAVVVIVDLACKEQGGVCIRLIDYSSKWPLPTFCFKVV